MTNSEAEQRGAARWLDDYLRFWDVRCSFYILAFGLEGAVSGAARAIPGAEDFLSLNPTVARQLWTEAMREAGGTLSREKAAELSAMSATGRLDQARTSAEVLGLTPAGFKRLVPVAELEDEAWAPGFWDWIARYRIAEGITEGATSAPS